MTVAVIACWGGRDWRWWSLSIVEQRYLAVLAVQAGEPVVEMAVRPGVSRQFVHSWLARCDEVGLAGLEDRSHRPRGYAHQASAEVT
ncbi:helix-turn-helix domain-containing protein [Micromonospora chalcea]